MYYIIKRTTVKQNHWHWFNRVNQTAASNLHNWIITQSGVVSVTYSGENNTSICNIAFNNINHKKEFEQKLMLNPDNIARTNYHATASTIDTYESYLSEIIE